MKYAWIDAHRRTYPLLACREALDVSASGYRARMAGGTCTERLTEAQALVRIRTLHAEVRGAYGSRRVHQELHARGRRIGRSRVERLMSEHGIRARHKRRYKATTDSGHALPIAQNVLDRDFAPAVPDKVWTSDITCIWTDEGWLYLAWCSTCSTAK